MQIVTFDALRCLDIPGVRYIKPEQYLNHLPEITQADWVLFPEYWQVNALHYGLGVRLFPSIASYHIGHDKIEQTRAFQLVCPHNIPDTQILENSPENAERLWDELVTPFVAKDPRSSEGRGVFLIEDRHQWRDYCAQSPVLYVQERLPINRDLRLVLVGKKVVAGYWRLQSPDGFHNNVAQGGQLDFSPLPATAVQLVEQVAQRLDINHGGFDVAMVGSHPYIIEYNRLCGNQGLVEQGIRIGAMINDHLLTAGHSATRAHE
jgi:ribosomal protein S6--L-glutamate ligase